MRNQRSLLNFAILVVVAAATGGFVVNKASQAVAEIDALGISPAFSGREEAAIDTSTGSTAFTANWKTYRNEKYGFEIKYPATAWLITTTATGLTIALYSPAQSDIGISTRLTVEALPQYQDRGLDDFYTAEIRQLLGGDAKNCRSKVFFEVATYECRISYEGAADAIFFKKGDTAFEIYDAIEDATSSVMTSTFKFIK